MRASAYAPGSIGNVGPGFDVLGLAVGGAGDTVTVELHEGEARVESLTGRDAELVPRDPERNCAAIAAMAMLRMLGVSLRPVVSIEKGLALAGGMGGSAASSVAGAYAAMLATEAAPHLALARLSSPAKRERSTPSSPAGGRGQAAERPGEGRPLLPTALLLAAALEGESAVAGRHLDNIAPSVLGGLALVRSVDPIDVIALPVAATWWVALVTPRVRIQTKDARALLPNETDRATWIQQMANTTALAHAFAAGDGSLLRRALDDRYAEPRRASLIPHFHDVKCAALDAGALGCSISGSGPTIFAIAEDAEAAERCAASMQAAFAEVESAVHVGPIEKEGVRGMARVHSLR